MDQRYWIVAFIQEPDCELLDTQQIAAELERRYGGQVTSLIGGLLFEYDMNGNVGAEAHVNALSGTLEELRVRCTGLHVKALPLR